MKSFTQYITEVFDKPYKWRGGHDVAVGDITPDNDGVMDDYAFKTSDGGTIEFTAHHWWYGTDTKGGSLTGLGKIKKDGHLVAIEFVKRDAQFDSPTYDMTGEGDAMRIMATVLDIINAIIKKHEPAMLYFSGNKHEREKGGRVGAYKAIIKRFAGKAGYESITKEYSNKVSFQLVKK